MKRPNYDIVLRALERGDQIELGGHTYAFSDEGKLAIRLSVYNGPWNGISPPDEERWCECEMGLNEFFGYCNEITEEDIFSIVSRAVLQKDR